MNGASGQAHSVHPHPCWWVQRLCHWCEWKHWLLGLEQSKCHGKGETEKWAPMGRKGSTLPRSLSMCCRGWSAGYGKPLETSCCMWAVRLRQYLVRIIYLLPKCGCWPPSWFSLLPGRFPSASVALMFKIIIKTGRKKKGNFPNLYFMSFKILWCVSSWDPWACSNPTTIAFGSIPSTGESWMLNLKLWRRLNSGLWPSFFMGVFQSWLRSKEVNEIFHCAVSASLRGKWERCRFTSHLGFHMFSVNGLEVLLEDAVEQ